MNSATMIRFERYTEQQEHWPNSGRHILAQFDDDNIIVYQAFRPAIAEYALANQRFGGSAYSFARMSWIKSNFLWMMFRSGWGTKEGQEYTLAITIPRSLFDEILRTAAWSSYTTERYASFNDWNTHKNQTDVRLQWDPDHNPLGHKLARRAVQLGLKGRMLERLNQNIVSICDLSSHVSTQKDIAKTESNWTTLLVPKERVYSPACRQASGNVLIDAI